MADDPFAPTPAPPYWVAVFTSHLAVDFEVMLAHASEWYRLAARTPGFIGAERARCDNGFGIVNTYWTNRRALEAWFDALEAIEPDQGPNPYDTEVFDRSVIRIARVEHDMVLPPLRS